MKIVVLDGYTLNPGDNPWDPVAALGQLEVWPRTAPAEVVSRAAGCRVVLTNKTVLDRAVLEALPELAFIGVLATGVNVVDTVAAAERGIVVANVPAYSTEAVAQHTIALLMELANGVGRHDRLVHEGRWAGSADFSFWERAPVELSGRRLGLIGHGAIGRRVGELGHALGMEVVASAPSRSTTPAYQPFAWMETAEVFATADVVSLHCPATDANRGMVDARMLSTMRPGGWLLNTARGALVDEDALVEALVDGRLGAAALDVVAAEPPSVDSPLWRAPNLVVTPHMAWASVTARRRLMEETAANIAGWMSGNPRNVVSAY
jgi:glycerate dehydrogenase